MVFVRSEHLFTMGGKYLFMSMMMSIKLMKSNAKFNDEIIFMAA